MRYVELNALPEYPGLSVGLTEGRSRIRGTIQGNRWHLARQTSGGDERAAVRSGTNGRSPAVFGLRQKDRGTRAPEQLVRSLQMDRNVQRAGPAYELLEIHQLTQRAEVPTRSVTAGGPSLCSGSERVSRYTFIPVFERKKTAIASDSAGHLLLGEKFPPDLPLSANINQAEPEVIGSRERQAIV